jgi:hypothetical protein
MIIKGRRGYYEITISQLSDESFRVDVIDNLPTGQRPIGSKILDAVTNSESEAKAAAAEAMAKDSRVSVVVIARDIDWSVS